MGEILRQNSSCFSDLCFNRGTNWGGIPYPGATTRYELALLFVLIGIYYTSSYIASSYDYGASIRESRILTTKYDELKRQGLFLRSSPDFKKTDWIGDSNSGIPSVSLNSSAAFVTFLRNPDTGAGFYILRQNDSTSTYAATQDFFGRMLSY